MVAELAQPAGRPGDRDVAVRLDAAAGIPAGALAGARADLYATTAGHGGRTRAVLRDVLVVSASADDGDAVATLRVPERAGARAGRRRGPQLAAAGRARAGADVNGRGAIRALVIASGPGTAPALTRAVELAPGIELAGEVDAMRALAGLRPACDAFLVVGDPTVVRELARGLSRRSRRCWSAAMRTVGICGWRCRPAPAASCRRSRVPRSSPHRCSTPSVRAAPAQERRRDGRVVAVCGAKGGVGATTVAVGIAAAASGMLVDAAAGHGTLAGHLGCHPQRSLADLARLAGSVGAEAVAAVRTEHPSGIGRGGRPVRA